MRENKFRAWSKCYNSFLDLTAFEVYKGCIDGIFHDGDYVGYDKDNISLIQYTGAVDKHGVEIYEGDILLNKSIIHQPDGQLTTKVIGSVQILNGMTYLIGKTLQDAGDEDVKMSEYRCLMLSPELFEVTGNIYENLEGMN